MKKTDRTQLVLGLLLILAGAWFIASQQVPQLREWLDINYDWPLGIIAAGGLLLMLGLVLNAPGMAVPAAIVAGVGGILYYQELNNAYHTWSFMWSLIPGFVGIGVILTGLLGEKTNKNLRAGANLLVISAFLFLIFGAMFGGLTILGPYGPAVLLILLGVYILIRGFARRS